MTRAQFFAQLCTSLNLKICVELGTDRGLFAFDLLSSAPHISLFCVDPWLPYPEIPHERGVAYNETIVRLQPFGDRVKIVKDFSVNASKFFKPSSIDFVYIDGDHSHAGIETDMISWYRKVKGLGVVAGHDYDLPQVKQFVDSYVKRLGAKLELYTEQTNDLRMDHNGGWVHPSWYFRKSV